MREIKFRAWYGDRMQAVKELTFTNGTITIVGQDDGMFMLKADGKPCVMQYTGLKDKNGTEIYEGDIVKWQPEWFESDDYITKVIAFEGIGYNFLHASDAMIVEVIGNIYENPELLKGSA